MTSTDSAVSGPLPILYKSVTPLNKEQHRALRINADSVKLGFAQGVNLVPALVEEFPIAAREIPIIFVPDGGNVSSVFLLGLKQGFNSFVTPEGMWTASYVPAYIRRYPFILGEVPNAEPILCLDRSFAGFSETAGDPLFDEAGAPSKFLQAALEFSAGFRGAAEKSMAFINRLRQLDLFRSVTLEVKSPQVGDVRIDGVLVVDEDKLAKLSDADMLDLARSGALKAIYAHIVSMNGVPVLKG